MQATWWPEAAQRPAPSESTGAFAYEGALPIPNIPPRPHMDPSQRVAPAPHPGGAEAAPAEEPQAYEEAPVEYAGEAEAGVDPHAETYAAESEYEEANAAPTVVDEGEEIPVDAPVDYEEPV